MAHAACIGIPTEMFFPENGQQGDIIAAKRVCKGCPVKAECREYARETDTTDGIWGGVSGRTIYRERWTR